MTNEFLANNIHLIRYAVDVAIDCHEGYGNSDPNNKTYKELKEFQAELEKQAITGDSA